MSDGQPTLRERYEEDFQSGSLPVVVTAVPIGLLAAWGILWSTGEHVVAVPLLLLIAVFVPRLHERHWSGEDDWWREVSWALLASAVVTIGFFTVYSLALPVVQLPFYAGIAGLLAILGIAEGGFRLRDRLGSTGSDDAEDASDGET